jgi:hypothetical protein
MRWSALSLPVPFTDSFIHDAAKTLCLVADVGFDYSPDDDHLEDRRSVCVYCFAQANDCHGLRSLQGGALSPGICVTIT